MNTMPPKYFGDKQELLLIIGRKPEELSAHEQGLLRKGTQAQIVYVSQITGIIMKSDDMWNRN